MIYIKRDLKSTTVAKPEHHVMKYAWRVRRREVLNGLLEAVVVVRRKERTWSEGSLYIGRENMRVFVCRLVCKLPSH